MPKRDPYETLRQMLSFAEEARELGANGSRGRLVQDLGYRRHAERVAELIGEAATRVPEELRAEWSQIPWIPIIGMRNWLIHGYDGIDVEILWDVLDFRAGALVIHLKEILSHTDDAP